MPLTSSVLRPSSYVSSTAIQQSAAKVAEETKLQEQKQLQEQTTKQQTTQRDLSQGTTQTQTAVNVGYALTNDGRLVYTSKEKPVDKKNVKNNDANNNNSKNTGTEKEIIKTNETKLYSNFYSNTAYSLASRLSSGLTLSSVAKGTKIGSTKENDSDDIRDLYSTNDDTDENFVSTQTLTNVNAKSKVIQQINNQDNPLLGNLKKIASLGLYGNLKTTETSY